METYYRLIRDGGVKVVLTVGVVVVAAFLLLKKKKEEVPLYKIDSVLLQFMEHLGDGYNFTHIAIWATDQIRVMAEHKALIARGTVNVNDSEKHAFFIAQLNDCDFIPRDIECIDTNNTVGLGKSKPFVALFTGDKKIAALSITSSRVSDVWVSQLKSGVVDPKNGAKKFVYKDKLLVSTEFREEEWIKMDKPMKLRELNACIYKTSCSGNKYDVNNNNSQHFVSELRKCLVTSNER